MKPSDADVKLILSDGSERTINMLRMLVHTQNAEMMAKYGMCLPGVAKLHPTVKALREEYGIPARTWADAATQMREMYSEIREYIAKAQAAATN